MDHPVLARLRHALPRLEISERGEEARRRARSWTWPAVQMGIAAAAAWWTAGRVAADAASYAPITAIVALGLGRERRLGRSALMAGGLFVGVVAAELATRLIGVGWWQVGVCMVVTAVATGALIGRDLAVTYAAINAVVLLTTPGSDGWFPSRVVAGLVGVIVALVVILLVAPPHPVHLVRRRLRRVSERAVDALCATADALGPGREDAADAGPGDRPLLDLARRLDDEIEQSHATLDQAGELTRWSPWRRRDAGEVRRLDDTARKLRPALRTASTIARLGDRAQLLDVSAPEPIRDALHGAAARLRALTADLLDHSPPDDAEREEASQVVDGLMDAEVERAVLVALKEEVRGLLSDLHDVVEHVFDDSPPSPDNLRAVRVGAIEYGRG